MLRRVTHGGVDVTYGPKSAVLEVGGKARGGKRVKVKLTHDEAWELHMAMAQWSDRMDDGE